ncbi:MAG: response regulator transcription factor [Bacteroidota bacterium]
METIRMAVIDDHDLFREGIKLVLGQIDGLDVVYDTSNGNRFVDILGTIPVDIALMDIEMPLINGIQTTIKALLAKPDLKILALTMFSDTGHYSQMIHAGAKGFILKKSGKSELQEAITAVYQGGNYFSPDILKKLTYPNNLFPAGIDSLTSREVEVMQLICKGFTSQEISDKLCISNKTVETHRSNIFLKSGVRNTAGLIVWAIKNQYFTVE